MCVQEGALDLLKELKGFNVTLKLLQVGSRVQYSTVLTLLFIYI